MKNSYNAFLSKKGISNNMEGFKPLWIPDFLYDFQKELVDWSIRKGRSAIFADCGLGKSVMELVWAKNIIQKTKGNILLLTPIAVGNQMLQEAKLVIMKDFIILIHLILLELFLTKVLF